MTAVDAIVIMWVGFTVGLGTAALISALVFP